MNILIIEDDDNKLSELKMFIESCDVSPLTFDLKKSYISGLKAILENNYDLVILDMSLPNYEQSAEGGNGTYRKFGGRSILKEIKRKNLDKRVVIVTQFEEFRDGENVETLYSLDAQFKDEFPFYLGSIYYNTSSSD